MNIYTVYKTINLVNGRYYIGKHKTTNPDDSYLGSGTLLKRAILKYGKENFTKEILAVFDNETDAYQYEQQIVSESLVNDPNSYNLSTGGLGGRKHSDETKKIMSNKRMGKTPWNKGVSSRDYLEEDQYNKLIKNITQREITKDEIQRRKHSRSTYRPSDETKRKTSEKLKGRTFSDETIEKMRLAKLGKKGNRSGTTVDRTKVGNKWKITMNGETTVIVNLKLWCEQNNIHYGLLSRYYNDNKIYKDIIIEKVED